MEPKDHYSAEDFRRFAGKEFAEEYKNFRKAFSHDFEDKMYLDHANTAHGISVLRVGHYHTRTFGPTVWAQATATGIQYYSGKPIESVCTLIPLHQIARIYYTGPYNVVLGAQESLSRSVGRKAGQHLAETIINVLFLLSGRLEQVDNPSKTDMLSNFKYLCMSGLLDTDVQEVAASDVVRQNERHPLHNTIEAGNKKRERDSSDHGQRIKLENDEEGGHIDGIAFDEHESYRHGRLSPHSASPSPQLLDRLPSSALRTRLIELIGTYEAEFESERERRDRSHIEKVEALQARMNEQNLSVQVLEEKATKERKKRKCAEERIGELNSELSALKDHRAAEATHEEIQRNSDQKIEIDKLSLMLRQLKPSRDCSETHDIIIDPEYVCREGPNERCLLEHALMLAICAASLVFCIE